MTRQEISAKYQAALDAVLAAELGDSDEVYAAAASALDAARAELIEAELKYPTRKEVKRKAEYLRLANRGVDVF